MVSLFLILSFQFSVSLVFILCCSVFFISYSPLLCGSSFLSRLLVFFYLIFVFSFSVFHCLFSYFPVFTFLESRIILFLFFYFIFLHIFSLFPIILSTLYVVLFLFVFPFSYPFVFPSPASSLASKRTLCYECLSYPFFTCLFFLTVMFSCFFPFFLFSPFVYVPVVVFSLRSTYVVFISFISCPLFSTGCIFACLYPHFHRLSIRLFAHLLCVLIFFSVVHLCHRFVRLLLLFVFFNI